MSIIEVKQESADMNFLIVVDFILFSFLVYDVFCQLIIYVWDEIPQIINSNRIFPEYFPGQVNGFLFRQISDSHHFCKASGNYLHGNDGATKGFFRFVLPGIINGRVSVILPRDRIYPCPCP